MYVSCEDLLCIRGSWRAFSLGRKSKNPKIFHSLDYVIVVVSVIVLAETHFVFNIVRARKETVYRTGATNTLLAGRLRNRGYISGNEKTFLSSSILDDLWSRPTPMPT
jgi:hypothetical protein